MDMESITLNEISWTRNDKYYMISLTCGILKRMELVGTENKLVITRGEDRG